MWRAQWAKESQLDFAPSAIPTKPPSGRRGTAPAPLFLTTRGRSPSRACWAAPRTGSPPRLARATSYACTQLAKPFASMPPAEIAILEQIALQTVGGWIDGARRRPCLQTRRQVRRPTDHTASLGFPEPTRSPTTTPTPIRTWSGSTLPSFPIASMSASPHRPLGVVFVRLQIAEIDEHPVQGLLERVSVQPNHTNGRQPSGSLPAAATSARRRGSRRAPSGSVDAGGIRSVGEADLALHLAARCADVAPRLRDPVPVPRRAAPGYRGALGRHTALTSMRFRRFDRGT